MARAQYPGVYRTGSETWCYKLRLPLDAATGKRPWEVRGAFTTARAAHDARTRRQAQRLDGVQPRRDGRTVADAVADWIGGRRRARVSSRHRWETTARLYITPYLGDVRLDRLDDRTIDRWISSLERAPNSRTKQAGLSAGTIGQARALLSSALSAEVRARRMTHNPALAVETPPVERTPPRTWTDDEIARALVAIDADERFGAAWLLLLLAQLRPGEVIGLAWSDVDLDAGVVRVERTRTEDADGRQTIRVAPKSGPSRRPIELPATCVDALRAHRRRQDAIARLMAPGWNARQLVVTSRTGGMASHNTIRRHLLHLCDAAGVTHLTPHGLRHTGATWLARLKVPPSTISARLGHASVAYTLDVYVWPATAEQRAASDQLDAASGRRVPSTVPSGHNIGLLSPSDREIE